MQNYNNIMNLAIKKKIDKIQEVVFARLSIVYTMKLIMLQRKRFYSLLAKFCKKLPNSTDVTPSFFAMRFLRTKSESLVIHR